MMTRAAPSQASRALLAAAGLPARWSGADAFTVLELELGDGATLLDALIAWRADPARCARLHWAALAPHPPPREALAAALGAREVPSAIAGPLLARWPSCGAGVHRIELEAGRVRIAIAVGDAHAMLPGWVPHADALLLRETLAEPARGAALLRSAASTLVIGGVAALVTSPDASRAGLEATLATLSASGLACTALAPPAGGGSAWRATRARGRAPSAGEAPTRQVLVVGAGLAGAASAAALARRGWSVVRVDAGTDDEASRAASLQPVLAQHPSVTPDDAPLSRLTRAATLLAAGVPGADALRPIGRLQCVSESFAARATRALPAEWVRAVNAAEASALAGVRLRSGGLWLPQVCSADPRALREAWTLDGIRVVGHRRVARLEACADGWRALDPRGGRIAEAPIVLLACGAGGLEVRHAPSAAPTSLEALCGPAGLRRRSGVATLAKPKPGQRPACIVGGDGHAVPIDGDRLLLGPGGASTGAGDRTPATDPLSAHGDGPARDRAASVPDELGRAWRRWSAQLAVPGDPPPLWAGPRGLRLSTRDHLPLAGPVPDPQAIAAHERETGSVASLPGLWIATALGGRGLLWSVLCAELIAARLEREPAPIERALARHLAPERFLLRARRRAHETG